MSSSISYYGLEVRYRIEYRTEEQHPTAVFHLAKPSTRHDEASRQEVIIRVPKGKEASDQEVIRALIPLFLKRLDVKLLSSGNNIRQIRELPLAALWIIDQDGMREQNKWSPSTSKEYASSFAKLINLWGNHDLAVLTPSYCSEKFRKMSSRQVNSMARALRALYRFESAYGHKVHAEWEGYQDKIGKTKRSPASLRKEYIEATSLSNAQLRELLQTCFNNLSTKDGHLYFGLMLMSTIPLTYSEVCALQFSSFALLTYYTRRLKVHITHEYILPSGNKNYRRVQLIDTYRIRDLPLPALILKAYLTLISPNGTGDMFSLIQAKAADDSPLIHHANNADRYLSPKSFGAWVQKIMQALFQGRLDCSTSAKAGKLLYNTVIQNLAFSGLEEDEIRYYRGVQPSSVASLYYCDVGNEAVLNKLGAYEDRWLDSLIPLFPASPYSGQLTYKTYNYKKGSMTFLPNFGSRCSLFAKIQCPPPPPDSQKCDDHFVMQILSNTGVDVSAHYIPQV